MKRRVASFFLLASCLALAAVTCTAQTVYTNGPINGNFDAFTINFGFIVSDTFNVTNNGTTLTGFSFGAWLFPGDTVTSAELSITSDEQGGTSFFDGTVNFTQGSCVTNLFGFNVCNETGNITGGPTLNAGTYWLNLQNASVPDGDPTFWDANSGPSNASENADGSIPSEAFTVLGTTTATTSSTSTTSTVPEPSSILLVGAGVVGLAGFVRRRLF